MCESVEAIIEQESNAVKLKNNKLKICFDLQGNAFSLKYHSQELLQNLTGEPADPDKHNSFYCDYHMNGQTHELNPNRVEIVEQSNDLVHIVFENNKTDLGIEYHILLKANDSAIYSYILARNNTQHSLRVNELRTVYRFDPDLFKLGFNGERIGLQPTSKEMMQGEKMQDETYRMQRGSLFSNSKIYSKYDYAGYFSKTKFWGFSSKNVGAWLIAPTKDYYGAGPLNQDLMIHYDGLILNYLFSEHFGKGLNQLPVNWQKMYGPWCLYLNDGELEDVIHRSEQEKAQIPYSWIEEEYYPKHLWSLTGNLKSKMKSKQYQIILMSYKKNDREIIECQNAFTYSAKTDSIGHFMIPNVRPGNYSVYAYAVDGDDLEIHCLDKEVRIDHDKKFSDFVIESQTKNIWQIGSASETTKGFVFSDQLRNYVWHNLVPKNLVYHIGQNDNWYYLQNNQGKWRIVFDLEQALTNCQLQISLAGATQKTMKNSDGVTIRIILNNKEIFNKNMVNDRSAYRSALLNGRHHLFKINIDKIPAGHNAFDIKTDGYLMYDTIKLVERKVKQ